MAIWRLDVMWFDIAVWTFDADVGSSAQYTIWFGVARSAQSKARAARPCTKARASFVTGESLCEVKWAKCSAESAKFHAHSGRPASAVDTLGRGFGDPPVP